MRPYGELFHYTNAADCLGILEGNLWSTHASFLNDGSEVIHTLEKAVHLAKEREKIINEANRWTSDPSLLNKVIEYTQIPDIYITSFSRKSDDLRQWMSYCQSNTGYCLAFNEKELTKHICHNLSHTPMHIHDVIYDDFTDASQSINIQSITTDIQIAARTLAEPYYTEENPQLFALEQDLKSTAGNIRRSAARFKSTPFREEEEARLIICEPNEAFAEAANNHNCISRVKFRTKGDVIIPYKEIKIKPDSIINEIIINKVGNYLHAKEGLEKLIQLRGYSIKVRLSDIPLR